ncbi:MAG: YitT family protein [Oscillospiraceae bacterium]|nr:YitT family protein [Oscillospiraceae bacterium]
MITKEKAKVFLVDILYDVIGCVLFSLGIYTFALNANFAPGGVSGLALIINYLSGLPIGTITILLNIPIVLVSYKVLGKWFLLKSVKTMLICSFFLDIVFPHFPVYIGEAFLASIFTGVFVGAGCAIIYMRGSSTGGADFLILSVKKLFPHLSLGQITLFMDACVVGLGGLVYGNIDAVLYGIIATFASTLVLDKIMYGAGSGKLAMIITDNGMEIAKEIDNATGRGATLLEATGTFSGQKKDMIMCACSNREIYKVRNAAHKIDVRALVMITEANEVFGEGFREPEITQKQEKNPNQKQP